MKIVIDHLGRNVAFKFPPKKIISLSPAITETLYELELSSQIVGRTEYCIYPKDQVRNAKIVGGTKEINVGKIHELKPDLVIVEKEENTKEIVEMLEKHYPVYVMEVQSISDSYNMITSIGDLTNRKKEANCLIRKIQLEFSSLPKITDMTAAYLIWKDPYMVAGKDTYIQSVLAEIGFINPFLNRQSRYPIVTIEDLKNAKLDYVLLASEPYSFKNKHKDDILDMMPKTKATIVDGEMFWYGARMLKAAKYFNQFFK